MPIRVSNRSQRLNQTGTITLDGAGAGTVTLGPVPGGRTWQVQRYSVITTGTAASVPQFFLYFNGVNLANLIDGTLQGDNDTGSLEFDLWDGELVVGRWTGGVPGAQATLTISGIEQA